jgi:metal-responsive CopG/Arc/MetJ family transcriptional regulator
MAASYERAGCQGVAVSPIDVCNRVRMNVRTNLLLPKDLVEEVDRVAGPRGRSRYVAEALEARLRRDRLRDAVVKTAGAWSMSDYPEFATSEMVVEWVRARRSEVTDPGPES